MHLSHTDIIWFHNIWNIAHHMDCFLPHNVLITTNKIGVQCHTHKEKGPGHQGNTYDNNAVNIP